MTKLIGKVAIVTGGSSGIGAATAFRLAEEGARVIVTYNGGRERANKIVAALPGSGHSAAQLQLENAETVATLKGFVEKQYGLATILVNSAGFTKPIPHGDLDALTDDFIDSVFKTSVRGPLSVIRAFAPLLQASGDGVVINISSISGFTGSGSNIAYCGAKAALDTMTMSLARALGPDIRLMVVSPGAVATDFVAGRDRDALARIA